MTATVFICQGSPSQDYSSLDALGLVRLIATRSIYPDEANERAQAVTGIAVQRLQNYNPDEDLIVLAGDPAIIGIVVSIAMSFALRRGKPHIRLMKWDKEGRAYYPIVFNIPTDIGGQHGRPGQG